MPFTLLLSAASGAAALIYEIVWLRQLELVVGSSAVSLGILLAVFMGGACLGSFLFPRLIGRPRNPLRVYAAIEISTGALALFVLLLLPLVGRIYTEWSADGWGIPLRGLVAAICLLPPTLFMGAAFPALARTIDSGPAGTSRLGFLYGANIAGAVSGCLLTGFWLLRHYDATTATCVAVAIDAAVAALAFAFAQPAGETTASAGAAGCDAAICLAIGLSGFCALAAEAIWTRTLGLLLGASVYTFSIILTVFLVGLGIGSAFGSLLCRNVSSPRAALGWCQLLLAGAIAWTSYTLSASLPYWPINPSISSSVGFNFQLDLALAFWALLPPTLLWGASFPLALAAAGSYVRDSARLAAGIYAANTLGAILGALSASLLLIAWVGSQRAEQLLIALSALAGLIVVARVNRAASLAALPLAGLLIGAVPPLSKLLVAHGRYAATWVGKGEIVYAGEGRNSSVAVTRFPNDILTFHVAGKIQASNVPRDMRLQRMLGHLTTLIPPHPRSVLVIGCGAGITAGAVSIDPAVERETIAEIEPLVPDAAATYFGKANFDVIRNPKVRVRIDDGRHYLLTTREKFDGITVDPLDPWVKGAANLYTREFYEAARRHLNPGGAITMYIQLFETTPEAVKSAVATFFEVFPNGTIWGNPYRGQGHDMVLLGQAEPLRIDLGLMRQRAGTGRIAESLAEIGMDSPLDLFATYAGRRADLAGWLRGAAINRDSNLRMQYLAGTGLNLDDAAAIYAGMLRYRRFPEDIFIGEPGSLQQLRAASVR